MASTASAGRSSTAISSIGASVTRQEYAAEVGDQSFWSPWFLAATRSLSVPPPFLALLERGVDGERGRDHEGTQRLIQRPVNLHDVVVALLRLGTIRPLPSCRNYPGGFEHPDDRE